MLCDERRGGVGSCSLGYSFSGVVMGAPGHIVSLYAWQVVKWWLDVV